jgi:hypothetical protein
MGMRKTNGEIKAEIEALKALLTEMPDQRRNIETVLLVLEDRMTHDDVYDRFEGTDQFEDAHAAVMWRDGQASTKEPLSAQFRELI